MGTVNSEKFTKRSPLKGFSFIVSGTVVGQVVTFFTLPILSRIYSPDQYGLVTIVLSLAAMIMPLAILGLDGAIVQAKNEREVTKIAATAMSSLLFIAFLFFIVLAFTPIKVTDNENLHLFVAVSLPLVFMTTGTAALLLQFSVRQESYGSIGKRNSITSISISVFQLLLGGFVGYSWLNGLVVGVLLGNMVGVLIMLPFARTYIGVVSLREMLKTAKSFWRFPVVFAPMTSLAQLTQQFPALFVASWYGLAASGQLGMAERIFTVPASILGLAGASVFVGNFSAAYRENNPQKAREIYFRYSKYLGLVALLVAIGCASLSGWLIPIFLGSEWETTANIMQVAALVAGSRILSTSFRSVFMVLNRSRLTVFNELLRVVMLAIGGLLVVQLDLRLIVGLALLYTLLAFTDLIIWITGFVAVRQFQSTLQNAETNPLN